MYGIYACRAGFISVRAKHGYNLSGNKFYEARNSKMYPYGIPFLAGPSLSYAKSTMLIDKIELQIC
jgi:hypothetical protein